MACNFGTLCRGLADAGSRRIGLSEIVFPDNLDEVAAPGVVEPKGKVRVARYGGGGQGLDHPFAIVLYLKLGDEMRRDNRAGEFVLAAARGHGMLDQQADQCFTALYFGANLDRGHGSCLECDFASLPQPKPDCLCDISFRCNRCVILRCFVAFPAAAS